MKNLKYLLFLFLLMSFGSAPSDAKSKKNNSKPPQKQIDKSDSGLKIQIKPEWIKLKKDLKNRRQSLSSPSVQRKLKRIYRTMSKKNKESQVIQLITDLEKTVQNRPAELARLSALKAQIYLSKENLSKSLTLYQKALKFNKLSYRKHLNALYDIITINILNNKIQKAQDLIDLFFYLSDKKTSAMYILKASILTEQKKLIPAVKAVNKALSLSSQPRESWLAFAVSLNIRLKNYIPAIKQLQKLTSSYPKKKQYWKQLSALYMQINKDNKALAILDLSYKMEFLEKEKEILHLASLLMYQGLPYKSAKIIEKSLTQKKVKANKKNYEILGDLWLRAEEQKKALSAYSKSSGSKVFAKMGRIYMQEQNWQNSITYFEKALKEGGIKTPENLYIAIGVAQVQIKAYEKALKAFQKIINNTKSKMQYIKTARHWINYTQNLMNENFN